MKENRDESKTAVKYRSAAVEFLLFLLEPEDTGRTAELYGRRQRPTRFDNRPGGAVKILFWLVASILFWGCFPDLCTMVAAVFQ